MTSSCTYGGPCLVFGKIPYRSGCLAVRFRDGRPAIVPSFKVKVFSCSFSRSLKGSCTFSGQIYKFPVPVSRKPLDLASKNLYNANQQQIRSLSEDAPTSSNVLGSNVGGSSKAPFFYSGPIVSYPALFCLQLFWPYSRSPSFSP